jgi:hypothetical protein
LGEEACCLREVGFTLLTDTSFLTDLNDKLAAEKAYAPNLIKSSDISGTRTNPIAGSDALIWYPFTGV